MPSSGASKVCQICHQDCSRKPRAKDAEGRSCCEECLSQPRAEALLRAGTEPARPVDGSAAVRASQTGSSRRLSDLSDDDLRFTGGFDTGPPKDLWKTPPVP